jgi:hypothetical protein
MKKKDVLPHLKVWLLQGKSITHNEAQKLWGTNRIAEYVRRLRKEGMKIETVLESKDGDTYGRYRLKQSPKVDRIKTRQYMNQY